MTFRLWYVEELFEKDARYLCVARKTGSVSTAGYNVSSVGAVNYLKRLNNRHFINEVCESSNVIRIQTLFVHTTISTNTQQIHTINR